MALRSARRRTPAPQTAVGYITLTYRIAPEESIDCAYAAECVELGTVSCGATIDEALDNIREATSLYLDTIEQSGERERIFKKRNIPIYLGKPDIARTVLTRPAETVSVAIHKLGRGVNGSLASMQ